jgi:hypothetical protein
LWSGTGVGEEILEDIDEDPVEIPARSAQSLDEAIRDDFHSGSPRELGAMVFTVA